jgi:hypothetical protein
MATSNESKSAEQVGGNISQEVEREAKGISSWSAPGAGDAAEGAGPLLPPAAPQGGVDAVSSAIMAMSDLGGLRKATEETAASAESAVQSALATSHGTDADVAKVVGVRSE